MAMADKNRSVYGYDAVENRIIISEEIAQFNEIRNAYFRVANSENIPLSDGSVESIFSYNAITLGPYRKTLREFSRLLRPGGLLYFNASDLGWFIYNIIDKHNPSSDFSPRDWAIDAISNTIKYFATGEFNQGSALDSILIPIDVIKHDLNEIGFEIMDIKGGGKINITNAPDVLSFFPDEKYGLPAVYEVLCRRR
ncbi:MAG: methyltransferase domain-containing protein [Ignavibacteriales bacterium]